MGHRLVDLCYRSLGSARCCAFGPGVGVGMAVLVSTGMDALLLQWRATTLTHHTAAMRLGPVDSRTALPTSTPMSNVLTAYPFNNHAKASG